MLGYTRGWNGPEGQLKEFKHRWYPYIQERYRLSEKYNTDTIPQRDVIRYTDGIYLSEKLYDQYLFVEHFSIYGRGFHNATND